jgi:hypothetical protein
VDKEFRDRPVRSFPKPGYDCSKPGTSCFYNRWNTCVNCGRPKGWKRMLKDIKR